MVDNKTHKTVLLLMCSKYLGNLLVALDLIKEVASNSSQHGKKVIGIFDEAYKDIVEAALSNANIERIYYPRSRLKNSSLLQKISIYFSFIRQLRAVRADTALDVDGDNIHGNLARLSGAKEKISHNFSTNPKPFNMIHHDQNENQHRWENYWRVFKPLLDKKPESRYATLNFPRPVQVNVESLIVQHKISTSKPLVIIHPSANKLYKQWPVSNFISFIQELLHYPVEIILVGAGRTDQEKVDNIISNVKGKVHNFCNKLTLPELYTLYKMSRLAIGNDSGPSHLAAASGTKTIALFGPTNDILWRPMGKHVIVLKGKKACAPGCQRSKCIADTPYWCLSSLTPKMLLETALLDINND